MKTVSLRIFIALAAWLLIAPVLTATEDRLVVFEIDGMGKGLRDDQNREVVPPVYTEIIAPDVAGAPWLLKHGGVSTFRETRYGYVSADGKTFITQPVFSEAGPFRLSPGKNPRATVCKDGKWNYIDTSGVPVFVHWRESRKELRADSKLADFYLTFRREHADAVDPRESYGVFVRDYVARARAHFVLRGTYESTENFNARVNAGTIEAATKARFAEADALYRRRHIPELQGSEFRLVATDFVNETAQIAHPLWGEFLVKLPMGAEAAQFERAMKERTAKISSPEFDIRNDVFALTKFSLIVGEKAYLVNNALPYDPNAEKKAREMLNAKIAEIGVTALPGEQNGEPHPPSIAPRQIADVDIDIPKLPTRADGKKRFALVIANENYRDDTENVKFALNDGNVVERYFRDVLGIEKITALKNLTTGEFIKELEVFRNLLAANPGAEAYLYYAGHAFPGKNGTARLLPTDASAAYADTLGVDVSTLYHELGNTGASRIVVFFDSCYSGGVKTANSRGVTAVADSKLSVSPAPQMIVFAASAKDQVSQPYAEGSHGLFTYFLLKKLKETRGDVSMNELFRYVRENVSGIAADKERYRLRPQTPTLLCGSDMNAAVLEQKLRDAEGKNTRNKTSLPQ